MPSEKAPGSADVRAQRSCWPLPGSADGERKRQRPPSEAVRSPPSRGVPCRLHLLPHPALFGLGRATKGATNLSSAGQDVATAQPGAVCNAAAGSQWSGGIRNIGRWRDFAQPQLAWGPGPNSFCESWPRLFSRVRGLRAFGELQGLGASDKAHPMESVKLRF